jgi:Zn-dependent M28 family amino/carboxypeptidase
LDITAHIENDIQKIKTRNIVGYLEGSDPQLKNQYIVLTAHYDHLGVNEELEGDDKIYNGALDNALGTACIINLGEAYSSLKTQPKRSIMFVACAAEEYGLLGSKSFVDNPPVELKQIVANFNIDSPQIFGLTTDVSAVGLEMSTLGDEFRKVAEDYGLEVRGNLNPNAGSFYRSDQLRFAQKGIPAFYAGSGRKFIKEPKIDLNEYRRSHYHQVKDEVDEVWDLTGCERDMRIQFQTILNVANNEQIPRWKDGNEFEDEWKELYNK